MLINSEHVTPLKRKNKLAGLMMKDSSRSESLGVSGEQRALSDVSDTAVELDDTLKTNTTATVRRAAILECVDVLLDCSNRNLVMGGTLSQELRFVNSLSSRCNLFTSHEEIVAVSVVGVMRVKHSVERTGIGGIAVEHVEVSFELLSHEAAENLFVLSAQILKRILSEAVVSEKLDTLLEVEAHVLALEGLARILIIDNLELLLVALLKSVEDGNEHLSKEVENLEVMFVENHFDIQACELTKVAVGV